MSGVDRPSPKQLDSLIFYDETGEPYSLSMCEDEGCEVQRPPWRGLYVVPVEEKVSGELPEETELQYEGLSGVRDGWGCPVCGDWGSQHAAADFLETAPDSVLALTDPYRHGT